MVELASKVKISIIVPVYNSEAELHRCVDSILAQTFVDYELLLIDDGSTDNSGNICDAYALIDSRVHVFHKRNGGVSSARNMGLNYAKGEYIAYCDSDDWVSPTMYEELYIRAIEENADIVYSDINMVFCEKTEVYKAAIFSEDKVNMMKNYISSVWTSLANMLARRELYQKNRLSSPTHICYCEDFWLSVRLFFYANKISYINKPFYNYDRTNETSILHSLNRKTELEEQKAYLETIDFFLNHGCLSTYERELSWRILKSKQEMVLDASRHPYFLSIFPNSHNYIYDCPYVNKKIKFMMWLLVKKLYLPLHIILKTRSIIGR